MYRANQSLLSNLHDREHLGPCSRSWQHALNTRRHASLALNSTKLLHNVHKQAVTWLELDCVENRYLLSGAADATVAIFDTQQEPTQAQLEDIHHDNTAHGVSGQGHLACGTEPELQPLLVLDRNNPSAHRFLVSCVCWYPVDTGLFVTGSYDQSIKVWDTNSGELVTSFALPARVTAVAMSPVAACHCLIAGACQQQHIRLCDPSSGAFTHTLSGHREAVSAVAWSVRSEFQLATGDICGQVRVWDIRRSGCLLLLDQYCTTPAAMTQAMVSGASGGKPHAGLPTKRLRNGSAAGAAAHGSGAWSSSDSQRKAHQGVVTSVLPCPGGLFWLTAGADSRVRLWDAYSWHNTLVSYPETRNRASRARRLAVSDDGRVLFNPCDNDVQVFDLHSGQLLHLLRQGHYGPVNCCQYGRLGQELFTGGEDGQILVWSPMHEDEV